MDLKSETAVLFCAHGSPMNIIANNDYTDLMGKLSLSIKKPAIILMVSAHWSEYSFTATSGEKMPLIYDFFGFPDELYAELYPAIGSSKTASELQKEFGVNLDAKRGLDHGGWAVLKKLFPKADVPVVQVSLNRQATLYEHYEFGKKLATFRDKGAMIIASGNLTHNLSEAKQDGAVVDKWAQECEKDIMEKIVNRDIASLLDPMASIINFRRAHPTIEHFVPAVVALGAIGDSEKISALHSSMQNGSISMSGFYAGYL